MSKYGHVLHTFYSQNYTLYILEDNILSNVLKQEYLQNSLLYVHYKLFI